MIKQFVSFLRLCLFLFIFAGLTLQSQAVTQRTEPGESSNHSFGRELAVPTVADATTVAALTDEQRETIEAIIRDSTSQIWFENNVGQFPAGVRYGFRTTFGAMLVYDDHLQILADQTDPTTEAAGIHTVNMSFDNGNAAWQIVPGGLSDVTGSYQNPDGTTSHPNIFKELTLRNVYDGIDLRLYSAANGTVEFDWLVARAQDYQKIQTVFMGQDGITYDADGAMTLGLRYQDLTLQMPETYQVINGVKQNITARMVAGDRPNTMHYQLSGNIVANQPLVIDPSIAWSTYIDLNVAAFDAYNFAIAANGNGVYVAGWMRETVTNAAYGAGLYMEVNAGFSQGTAANQNYIYRLNGTGTNITAWTSTGVAAPTGGVPASTQKFCGAANAIVDLGLFPDGRVLAGFCSGLIHVYAGNLATRSYNATPVTMDTLNAVSIKNDNTFYTSGRVAAAIPVAQIPAANIGPDATFAGSTPVGPGILNTEGVIIRYTFAGVTPVPDWATYVGGAGDEYFTAIEMTPDGSNVTFVTSTGVVAALGYPAGVNAVDATPGAAGTTELLVGVLADGVTKPAAFSVFSYLGDSGNEGTLAANTTAAVVTASNTAFYVAGNTALVGAPAMPGITGGAQLTNGGGALDAFIARIPINGSAGAGFQTTYIGGAAEDNIGGLAYDTAANQLLVFGTTAGAFPTQNTTPVSDYFDGTPGGGLDIFVAIFASNLQSKVYATFIGGADNDYLGQTGDLIGQGHVVYSPATGLSYLATTVHSALPAAAIGTPPGKDRVKSNTAGTDDAHTVFAFNLNSNDFGDAPASYEGGTPANSAQSATIRIGATVDVEAAPVSGATATGDDTSNTGSTDDEDGIATLNPLGEGATTYSNTVSVLNNSGAARTLQGWIDTNLNGTFDVGEYTSVSVPANAALQNATLTWSGLPALTVGQQIYMRLRLNDGALTDNVGTAYDDRSVGSSGAGTAGEVEDYLVMVVPVADLVITKTNGFSSVSAGGTTTYTLTLTNNGPNAADNTTLSDPAVAGLTKTAIGVCTPAGGAVCPTVGAGAGQMSIANLEAGTVVVPTLPNGGSISFTVTANVTATSGNVTNTFLATPPSGTVDPTPATASDTDAVTSLLVTKSSSAGGTVNPGDTITYTINITNNGSATQNDIVVADALPIGTTYVPNSTIATGYTLLPSTADYLHTFENGISFSGTQGSISWDAPASPWVETDNDDAGVNETTGNIQIVTSALCPSGAGNCLRFANEDTGDTVYRQADLTVASCSGATSITLTYDYNNQLDAGNQLDVYIYTGATQRRLVGSYTNALLTGIGSTSFTLVANEIAANTRIRLNRVADPDTTGTFFYMDNVRFACATQTSSAITKDNDPISPAVPLDSGVPSTLVTAADSFDLGVGQSMTVTYQVTVNSPVVGGQTQVINTASVTSVETATPAQATVTDNINSSTADLSVTKTDSVAAVDAGGATTYTLTLTNNGPSAANNTTLSDPAVAGLTKTAIGACTPAGGAVCPTVGVGAGEMNITNLEAGTVVVPTLPNGGSLSFTVTANVTATNGTVANTFTSTPPVGTTDLTPATVTDTDNVNPIANLVVTKTDGVLAVDAGGTATYTLTLTNNGPSTANNSTLSDPAVAGLTKTAIGACTPAGGAVCPTVGVGVGEMNITNLEAGTVVVPTLPNGGSISFTVTVNITATNGTVANTFTSTPPVGTTDPTPATVTDTDNVNPIADLVVTKTDGVLAVDAGGTTTYTLTLTNNGPSAANNATLSDPAVAGLTKTAIGACTPAGGAVCPTVGAGAGQMNIANLETGSVVVPTLPNGGSISFTVTVDVAATNGSVANTFTSTPPVGTTDPTPATVTDTDNVNPIADLVVTKTDGVLAVDAGGTTTYTLTLTNNGPSAANNATLSDPAVAGLTKTAIGACTPAGGAVCPTVGVGAGQMNIANLETGSVVVPTLPNGGSISFTVTVDVTATNGSVANTFASTPPVGTTDPTPATVTDTDTVNPIANLVVTKTDGVAAVDAGGTTTYTLTLTNNGPSAANNTTLSDPVVAGLTKTAIGACTPAGGAVCPTVGVGAGQMNIANLEAGTVFVPTLPNGGSISFTVTVNITATNGTVANTFTSTPPGGTTDPTPATVTDTDNVNPIANLVVTKTDGVAAVDAGGTTTYTLTLTNNGPSAANNATLSDPAVAGLTKTAIGACTPAAGAVCPTVGVGAGQMNITNLEAGTVVVPTLPNGGSISFTVTANVTAPNGTVANTFTSTPPVGTTDPTPATTTDTDTVIAINAVNDTGATVDGTAGGQSFANVLTNDTLNGNPATLANITLTQVSTTNAGVTLNPLDGSVNVAPGTPAGNYTVTYQICDQANPTFCDTATISVPVVVVNAVNDTGASVNGYTGGQSFANILTNDTLNGNPATLANITLTQVSTTNAGVTLNPADGSVNVAAGTPAGNYTVTYQICDQANPTICDIATVSVPVIAAPINAVDDSAVGINGLTGATNVLNVFTNDTLNGVAVIPAEVTLTQQPGGDPELTLNANGSVDVAPNTPAGIYTLDYQICEILNPTNCDIATVTITVVAAPIVANDDNYSATPINGYTGGSAGNAFTNDTLNGVAVNPADITATMTIPASNPGVTMNTGTGAVTVAAGTPAGTYTIDYQICENLNPTNCDPATITVVVNPAVINAVDDDYSTTPINGYTGGNAGNAFTNDTLNGVAVNVADITATVNASTSPNVALNTGTGAVTVAAGTPAGTYTIDYQICENLNPTNCDPATITVVVNPAVINAVDDSAVGVNGLTGATNVLNVFTNDTLNGVAVIPAEVTLTQQPGGDPELTLNPNGSVDVAPNTPAGIYTLDYQICEILNPTNCDIATVTITVVAAPIVANDDDYSATPINGYTGGNAGNAFTNDTLNGVAINVADITATVTASTSPNVALNIVTGAVTVAAGTPAGTYTIDYQICENLNLTNCDPATITVVVNSAVINAVDDSAVGVNGLTGATNVLNVFTNDTLNGVAVIPAQVALTQQPGGDPELTLNPNGSVDIAPNTPAGIYTLSYQICEILNPTNCDIATVTITVVAAPIVANDDDYSATPVNGYTGGNAGNAFTNDTLNGVAVNVADITATVTASTSPNVALNTATGAVTVAPNTPAGTYTIDYQICENLNPTNCDPATITVVVNPAVISAVDDDYSATPINGYTGGNAGNAFTNDTLNGVAVNVADITASVTASTSPNVALNIATGAVTVAAGTPAGTYTIDYQICENLNPTNCDPATITVVVSAAPIVANDDSAVGVNGLTGATNVLNVFTNDTLNGVAVIPAEVTLTQQPGGDPELTLNANGSVDVAPNTPAGIYTLDYQICEILNPTNCDIATVTITVVAAPIVANDDDYSATPINGYTGGNAGNAFTNDTLNGVAVNVADITATVNASTSPNVALNTATGAVTVAAGTPAGTYTIDYQICENLNPTNCDPATITVVVNPAVINAVDDSAVGVNGLTGATNVLNVFTNDTLNGVAVVPAQATLTQQPGGDPELTLNPNGSVDVAPNTPAGIYTLDYQICEILNPTNCDIATVTITVVAAPIVANDDDYSATPINGYTGGNAGNAFTNDTLNGVAINVADITATVTASTSPTVALNTATGAVTVAAGTPAGTYTIDYQICENLNPTNCDPATVTVVVSAAPIVANDDSVSGVNGLTGATNVLNVFTNDTLNGVAVIPAQVTLTQQPGGDPELTLNANGSVDVAPNTPAGIYTLNYQICEILNPTNCDIATVTITVVAAPIVANDDDYSATPINGYTGGNAGNAFTNDTLNGVAVNVADITATITTPASNPGVTMNIATGAVTVAAGTPAGTYTIDYQICENLNPTNCDPATITVVVNPAVINAVDDSAVGVNGLTGATNVLNVFTNDTLNGVAVVPAQVTLTQQPGGDPELILNPNGSVDVAPNTPAGIYTLNYQICEILNPTNCDIATVTITVVAAPIVANDDDYSATPINGYTGGSAGNAFTNDTLNGVAVNPANITATVTASTSPNVALNTGTGAVTVAAGTPAGTYTIDYQICENLNPTNCDPATITVVVNPPVINAVDDSAVGVNGLTGATNVLNVFTNDTLNGVAVTPAQVTLTQQPGGDPELTLNANGSVDVAPNTPAGIYTLDYQICEILNPTNCDIATVTITVNAAVINAVDDTGGPVSGLPGATNVLNVFTNDTLNGVAVIPAQVTLTQQPGGDPELTLNANGSVDVAPNTPAGIYTLDYQICENLNPTNCDIATVTITVVPVAIVAVDDDYSATPVNGYTGGNAGNAFTNDTLNGVAINVADITATVTASTSPNVALNIATGAVTVATGTPAGTYTIDYQICENLNLTNCDTAVVTVVVNPAVINAVDDSATGINGITGATNVLNVFTNDTLNGVAVVPAEVTLTQQPGGDPELTLNPNGSVDVAPGTAAGTYQLTYEICEVLNPTNCDTAVVRVTVGLPPAPTATDDSTSTPFNTPATLPNITTNDTAFGAGNSIVISTIDLDPAAGQQTSFTDASGNQWSVNTTTGIVTFTPALNFTGVATIPYTVQDAAGQTATADLSVTVAPPASVSGVVFHDVNLDGSKSASEPGIVGVIVNLYDSTGTTLIASTTTGVGGAYSFPNLMAGSYQVVEIDPAGYVSSTANSVPVTLVAGGSGTANFGDYQLPNTALSNISGVVFNDADGNGVQGAGETPLSGVTVELKNNLGVVIATTTTNASGAYTFTNLSAGTYAVVETDLPGYVSTTLNSIAVTLSAGTNATLNYGDQTVAGNPLIADPAVTKLGSPTSAVIGDVVVYTITVGNNGNTNATGVVLTDTKPAFLDIIAISISPNPGLTPVISGNTFTINFGTVTPTDFFTITVLTRVNAQGVPPGGVNNAAIVTNSGTDRTVNNASSALLSIPSTRGGVASALPVTALLPATGFAPNAVTSLPAQPSNMLYAATDLLLEIPRLGVKMPIVGVAKKNGAWDVTWLGKQAGWLEGTAFPSWNGNSVLTGHVYDSNGLPGPFVNLSTLKYGDKIIVHAYGQKYTFEIRTNQIVAPNDISVLKHEEKAWLTLVTCKEYDEKTNTYKQRVVVRAILVSVDWDK